MEGKMISSGDVNDASAETRRCMTLIASGISKLKATVWPVDSKNLASSNPDQVILPDAAQPIDRQADGHRDGRNRFSRFVENEYAVAEERVTNEEDFA
jgi:hypothetical protein